jgi:hypothetical protein
MMQIPNPQKVPVSDVLHRIQHAYPTAILKKPWLSPEIISIPVDNYHLFVRPNRTRSKLVLDFQPPLVWNLIGIFGTTALLSLILSSILRAQLFAIGALPVLIGFFGTKAIFKNRIRERLGLFRRDVDSALTPEEHSVF